MLNVLIAVPSPIVRRPAALLWLVALTGDAALAGLSTPELLAGANQSNYRLAAMALQKRVAATDLDLLLDAAQRDDRWQRFVAFRGLQRLAHPAALPVLHAFFESSATRPGSAYGAAVRAITALPADVTLELARTWFDAPDSPQRHVALQILETHGTAADVPRVRDALIPSLRRDTPDTNECHMQCGMLEILARFPEAGPYPEVETVFKEAGYSRTPIYAAEVLAASDGQGFTHGLAVECLWDCEERVRLIGCNSVDLEMPDVRARLHAMSRDPYEDEAVCSAARERLPDVQPAPSSMTMELPQRSIRRLHTALCRNIPQRHISHDRARDHAVL